MRSKMRLGISTLPIEATWIGRSSTSAGSPVTP
jgi:hypothetical protein